MVLPWPLQGILNAATRALLDPGDRSYIDFSRPTGEAALVSPDSVSWRVFKNPLSLFIGGVTAVVMELAEPRVRTGVWEHKNFRTDPIRRRHQHHRSPELHRRPEPEITKKESATAPPATSPSNRSASCRCTNQADRAGRADRIASRHPASRARVRAASMVNADFSQRGFRSGVLAPSTP
jgi:hypothetical protein